MSKIAQEPHIAALQSIKVAVKAGNKYAWCSCGLSKAQPFCDSAHKNTNFSPIIYQATEDKIVSFCGCKHSSLSPLCDGSHKNLLPASNKK